MFWSARTKKFVGEFDDVTKYEEKPDEADLQDLYNHYPQHVVEIVKIYYQ
jgi:hypothetical protein